MSKKLLLITIFLSGLFLLSFNLNAQDFNNSFDCDAGSGEMVSAATAKARLAELKAQGVKWVKVEMINGEINAIIYGFWQ